MSLLLNHLLALPHMQSKALAFCDEQENISFQTLWQQTQRLANGIATLPLAPGDRVLVAPLPTRWAIAVTYACWWLGLVIVPLTPRYLREQNLALLNELNASAIVADTDVLTELGKHTQFSCPNIMLRPPKNRLSGWWNRDSRVRSLAKLSCKGQTESRAHDEAVIFLPMHTQGAFAIYTHQALMAQLSQLQQVLHPVLQTIDTPVLASVPLWHSFGFISHVVLLPAAGLASFLPKHYSDTHCKQLIDKHGFCALTGFSNRANSQLLPFDSPIKQLLISGSYLSKLERQQLSPHINVHIAYGCRESGPAFAVALDGSTRLAALPHGRFDILGDDGKPVAPGEIGQLRIKGPQMFAGYWRRRHATQEVIDEGWLLTKDLARRNDALHFSVLGRAQDCFQVAGDWVIAPVMERQLMQALAINQAKVEATKLGDITVVRLTVSGEAVNIKEIETYCRLHFAGHLVPKFIDVVEHIETDPLGNVIRQQNQYPNEVVI